MNIPKDRTMNNYFKPRSVPATSLRDEIAIRAMQALVSTGKHSRETIARKAYKIADEMLEARNEQS